MKKVLFIAIAVCFMSFANAQEVITYKPVKGDVTADFGFSGGLNNASIDYSSGVLKGRYFFEENMAYRVKLNLDVDNKNNKFDGKDNKTSSFDFGLGLGLEKHFEGTKHLSPYIGGDVNFNYMSQSTENTAAKTESKGPNTFTFGLNGVFGADYYFVRNVYLGVEGGLGFTFGSTGETETTSDGTTVKDKKTASTFNINPQAVGSIRIGFVF